MAIDGRVKILGVWVIGSILFLQKKSSCWEEEEGGGGSCFIFTHNVSKVISRAIIAMQSIPISSNLQSFFQSFRM